MTAIEILRGDLTIVADLVPVGSRVLDLGCGEGELLEYLRNEKGAFVRGVELTRDNRRMLYVPEGFAHGYQALTDDSEVLYMVTQSYSPEAEAAIRWNDPAFEIRWPIADPILSPKDEVHPDFQP